MIGTNGRGACALGNLGRVTDVLTMQDALLTLQKYWTDRGCMVVQPYNTEVGAGTMNPNTVMRVLGPEPWHVAYVEPSVRPDDSRYGENPNRLQTHTQFQVILKPDPGNPQELYLGSLEALGIDLDAHDVRFVEDNWQQPAIGAWGLGWEVWLDGMEVTQFTYFQQVVGQNLEPVAVELTYGMERILMALQGVTHFKDMAYAEGISYGEVFAQNEYEMSRYYLDDADVDAARAFFKEYTDEAQRLIDARLPVPAWTYVLKSSHAFNILDSRGAVSTTERARSFSLMRRLARETGALWSERRAELGHPLLKGDAATSRVRELAEAAASAPNITQPVEKPEPAPTAAELGDARQTFAFEIGVEEMPPHVLDATIPAVRDAVTSALAGTRLEHGDVAVVGTPRRIVVTVPGVSAHEPDSETLAKGPKVAAAYKDGAPTKALEGFARGKGVSVDDVVTAEFDGAQHVAVKQTQTGRGVLEVLGEIVADVVSGLRSDKNMKWNDPQLTFSRPIRWVVALWGKHVVPATVGSLNTGRTTYVARTAAQPHVDVAAADELVPTLETAGFVLDPAARRRQVVDGALALAKSVGGTIDIDGEAGLVDEITNLVEEPHGVLGTFEERYLELPEQILTTVMRKHQRYLPVRDASGTLMPYFVTMANGSIDDDVVRAGNESVLRARYEDAAFFWEADLEVPLDDFRAQIDKLTFENRLGSFAQRADRIKDVSTKLAASVELTDDEQATLSRAGALAKFDLSTAMVVELSSLAGTMAREYALKAGETSAVAEALFEMEKPRSAGDSLPASTPGALLALADRFDLLTAMFAIGAKPTGSSDPFALRRAALGVVSILRGVPAVAAISVSDGLDAAAGRLREQGVEVSDEALASALEFVEGRFGQQLRDEGVSAALVTALSPSAGTPGRAAAVLADVEALRDDEAFRALVQVTQRITRIVPAGTQPGFDASALTDEAEKTLAPLVEALPDHSGDSLTQWFADASGLTEPLNRFFDDVLVMADDEALKAARLGLLQSVIAKAPAGIDYKELDRALDV